MEFIIFIISIIMLGYFLFQQISSNNFNNSVFLQCLFGIGLFCLISYLVIPQKSGPERAIFMESFVWLLLLPLLPFYMLRYYLYK